MKVQDAQPIHSVEINWHAKIVNVKIHVLIKIVPQMRIAQQPTIDQFVAVKEVSAGIHLPNVKESKRVHTILIARRIFLAVKENASTHALLNARIAAHAESLVMFLIAEIKFYYDEIVVQS